MDLLSRIDSPADLRRLPRHQLQQVAHQLRQYIIEVMSRVGGHTGASLGTVELTIALHYVFDTPHDLLIWDVGHQAYGHKVLTGRRDLFPTIRQYEGLSGFLRRSESEYDVFGAAHAGTSLSASLGMAAARDLDKEDHRVIAVIGDASIVNGMAVEALNQLGHLKKRMIIVLNDNEMSISPSIGAMHGYLNRIRSGQAYNEMKDELERLIKSFPLVGRLMFRTAKRLKDALARFIMPHALIEDLGIRYVGPVNGHDIGALIETFDRVKDSEHPLLVHVLTVKGKGYAPAEADKAKWHGTGAFDIASGAFVKASAKAPSYTSVFADAVIELLKRDERIVAITAAMPEGTGLDKVMKAFPERTWDVGIAEEHGVTFCAGLAVRGKKPIAAIYSTFLQRAFDQVFHDVILQHLDVTFALDRSGIVGADGPTHHGLMDFAYLRPMPGMVVMAPKDENELRHMLRTAVEHPGPAAVRYPRGNGVGVPIDDEMRLLEIGKAEILRDGGEVAILAVGTMVHPSVKAAEMLAAEGIESTVVNARFVKPLDADLILALARTKRMILTVEEHFLSGGFGSAVMELLESYGIHSLPVHRIGVPDVLVTHGDAKLLLAKYGLDRDGIYNRVKEAVLAIPGERKIGQASAL